MIKLMVTVFTFIKMAQNMKETGKTIFSMVMGKKYGQMAQNMKATIKKVKSMAEDSIYGKTDQCTTVIGTRTELKDTANTNGKMDVNIQETGSIITCMEKEFTLGLMVDDMKVTTKWIKSMDTVNINGLMDVNTKDTGLMENNMAKVIIS